MEKQIVHSAIYEGVVNHCRLHPVVHQFQYKVFMLYIDLSELEKLFRRSLFWSLERFNLASFFRKDYHGDSSIDLDQAVRNTVEEQTGIRPTGRICLLTNCRFYGYINNPVSCYYCYDENDQLQFVLAEVTNTPWGERHAYVIPSDSNQQVHGYFSKQHHVSPFMPMEMHYSWRSNLPEDKLKIFIDSYVQQDKQFFASLILTRRAASSLALRNILLRYPFMTLKVVAAIYWQALKLWLKKVPYYPKPGSTRKALKNVKGVRS